MTARYTEIAFSEAIRARQEKAGSRAAYARMEATSPGHADTLDDRAAEFIAARDSFYLATVTADGWPYVQHRGGPRGFLKTLGPRRVGFADVTGNRQYISAGNVDGDNRVALFLMDYANRKRLKILGRAHLVDAGDSQFPADFGEFGDGSPVERAWLIDVEAFDWNCPKHITPRFTEAELAPTIGRLVARIRDLEAQLELAAFTKPE